MDPVDPRPDPISTGGRDAPDSVEYPAWHGRDPPSDWPARRHDDVAVAWHTVFGLVMALLIIGFAATLALSAFGDDAEPTELSKRGLWIENAFSFIAMGAIPFLWVAYTRIGGVRGAVISLRMGHPLRGLGEGTLLALGLLAGLLIVSIILTAADVPDEQSDLVDSLLDTLDWPLVFGIAIVAGVAEEILFRGVLQRFVGVWGQGIIFGLSHAGYDTVLNVAIPLAIGLLFGFIYRWRQNLWTVIVAHFLYDLALLSAALWSGDSA